MENVFNRTPDYLKGISITQIFIAAFISQFCMGFELLIRLNSANAIKHDFFDATNVLTSGAMIGEILGVLFLGFAIANLVVCSFVDVIGSRRLHIFSLILFASGALTMMLAKPGTDNAFMFLWAGSLMQGFAWGAIEAVLNPLVASIYPSRKVPKLNLFHGAFALGMLLGAPACMLVEKWSLGWRLQIGMIIVLVIINLLLIARLKYPVSEREAQGVSFKGMFHHTFLRPGFYIFIFIMFISAATELVPSSWVDLTLTKVVGIGGFWLVAFMYSVSLIMRIFIVPALYSRLGASGILLLSAVFACIGVYLLSQASTPISGLLAAFIFGVGTGAMWPTMLATTSERFPGGGALAMGLVASAGMSSSYVLMPIFGKLLDQAKISIAGGEAAFKALQEGSTALDHVLISATAEVFLKATILPGILIVCFAVVWLYDRKRKKDFLIKGNISNANSQPFH